jgi:hypothetical protein
VPQEENIQLKKKRDSYSTSCFIFILLTLFSRITLKVVGLVIKQMRINYRNYHHVDPDWFTDGQKEINCELAFSSYLPTCLFTIAIFINATRWLHLIHINKE